jgi:hypothetical protein
MEDRKPLIITQNTAVLIMQNPRKFMKGFSVEIGRYNVKAA